MGGDLAPAAPVEAALQAQRQGISIDLVGERGALSQVLTGFGASESDRLRIIDAEEVIHDNESPSQAVRKKPRASINVAVERVAQGHADAVVSAGHSGAVMAAGLFRLGRAAGVERPALASAFPTRGAPTVVVDLGANVEPTPTQLCQFALMGEVYAKRILGRPKPKIAILSNGRELSKGTELTRRAAALLVHADVDFVGYREGRELFDGEIDVFVTDGFTGNLLLKTLEGFVGALRGMLEEEARSSLLAGASALLLRSLGGTIKRKLDYEEAGGAPLLGLRGNCIVAHGASTPRALGGAILAAMGMASVPMVSDIEASMQTNAALWSPKS